MGSLWGSYGADLADGHLVGGEGPGLIGADDGGAAQRLHGGEAAHDGVLLGHPPRPQSQAGRDHGRQTYGRPIATEESPHSRGAAP